jgi:hypothetical protein
MIGIFKIVQMFEMAQIQKRLLKRLGVGPGHAEPAALIGRYQYVTLGAGNDRYMIPGRINVKLGDSLALAEAALNAMLLGGIWDKPRRFATGERGEISRDEIRLGGVEHVFRKEEGSPVKVWLVEGQA